MMKILEKIKNNKRGQVVLASFGDSVTQGCFEAYASERDKCYGERMKQILNMLYPETPVVFVNGGLGGDTAHGSLNRINDVLRHAPDLTIVSFGLNDCGGGFEKIDAHFSKLVMGTKDAIALKTSGQYPAISKPICPPPLNPIRNMLLLSTFVVLMT